MTTTRRSHPSLNPLMLETELRRHEEWNHLSVRRRGKALIIAAPGGIADGFGEGEQLAKLDLVAETTYALSVKWHDGRSGTTGDGNGFPSSARPPRSWRSCGPTTPPSLAPA